MPWEAILPKPTNANKHPGQAIHQFYHSAEMYIIFLGIRPKGWCLEKMSGDFHFDSFSWNIGMHLLCDVIAHTTERNFHPHVSVKKG